MTTEALGRRPRDLPAGSDHDLPKDGEPEAPAYRVLLPRRGLQVQTGEVRYSYRHGISNADLHDARRVSITFRSNKDPNHHV